MRAAAAAAPRGGVPSRGARAPEPSQKRFDELVTQMKWRLSEGNGEAIYEIGVHDSGVLLVGRACGDGGGGGGGGGARRL